MGHVSELDHFCVICCNHITAITDFSFSICRYEMMCIYASYHYLSCDFQTIGTLCQRQCRSSANHLCFTPIQFKALVLHRHLLYEPVTNANFMCLLPPSGSVWNLTFSFLQGGCSGSSCGGCDCSGVKGAKVSMFSSASCTSHWFCILFLVLAYCLHIDTLTCIHKTRIRIGLEERV